MGIAVIGTLARLQELGITLGRGGKAALAKGARFRVILFNASDAVGNGSCFPVVASEG